MIISEEDDLDFFTKYCQNFFGKTEDPWDEDLLIRIWEEIKLEGKNLFAFFFFQKTKMFFGTELELAEAGMIEKLVDQSDCNQIVCPICLRLPAELQNGQITCNCGFMFPLPKKITLKDFETALETCSDLHSEACTATPKYEVLTTSDDRVQFTSNCESCQIHSIIMESQL